MARKNKLSPTIQDVAAAAGVSIATVSRVLNNRYGVASDTYSRVKNVVEELGYESSLVAKGMRSHQTNVIGFIVPDLELSFNTELVKGVARAIKEHGYELIIYSMGDTALGAFRLDWEKKHIARLSSSLTDGIIISTPSTVDLPANFPLVAIDPNKESSNFPTVISTNREGVLSVTKYLTDLGHRRIGFIGGRSDLQSATRRRQGYEDGLRQAGLPIAPELIEEGDFTRQTGYACAQKLLSLSNPPTAILAANDQSALGVLDAAEEARLDIPEDLSVAGFDNIPEAASSKPALTTVDQFISDMGHEAIEILVKLIQGKSLENNIHKVQTKLVIRDSCRSIS